MHTLPHTYKWRCECISMQSSSHACTNTARCCSQPQRCWRREVISATYEREKSSGIVLIHCRCVQQSEGGRLSGREHLVKCCVVSEPDPGLSDTTNHHRHRRAIFTDWLLREFLRLPNNEKLYLHDIWLA